ncbi:MAG TPA: bifunctional biotin--[acetyl-CoA-carboxylase] ligase/biotin operon repressor BirA [Acidiferrobacteraceae bacterium]|nr:bifunctional biotin--[acetyl-CoA-carboxylase] ligase/biotin operon repressor BirA [Acidiferrobacteraceae bacterium]
MTLRYEIVKRLADGHLVSGSVLGAEFNVSRAAVCKGIKRLRQFGLDIHSVSGRGYRLSRPLYILDRDIIVAALAQDIPDFGDRLRLLPEVDSTNRYLLKHINSADKKGAVCLAEVQVQGRGRHGRQWQTTPYRNVIFSMAWHFEAGMGQVAGLSLAAGAAIGQMLVNQGFQGIGLKWPNDLVWQDRKLGGMLIDVHGEVNGPCWVVLGLGLNIDIGGVAAHKIDRPWAMLSEMKDQRIDRNALVASLIGALWKMFGVFEREGLGHFQRVWERFHAYSGKPVVVYTQNGKLEGIAIGIDGAGALLLRDKRGQVHQMLSGEVSLSPL